MAKMSCPICGSIELEPVREYIEQVFSVRHLWRVFFCHGCGHEEQMSERLKEEEDNGYS